MEWISIGAQLPPNGSQVILETGVGRESSVALRDGILWKIFSETTVGYRMFITRINKHDRWYLDEARCFSQLSPTPSSKKEVSSSEEDMLAVWGLAGYVSLDVKVHYSSDDWEGGHPPPLFNFSLQHLLSNLDEREEEDAFPRVELPKISIFRKKTI